MTNEHSEILDSIITPVKYSQWAPPDVPVLKQNGTIRQCRDYCTTQACKIDS